MTTAALSQLALPRWRSAVANRAIGAVFFALLTALAAQVALPVPGTPVLITLQTLVVTLVPFALGCRWGLASMSIYVVLGTLGLPFFSGGGGGLEFVWGTALGYLVGFMACQPIMSAILGPGRCRASARRVLLALIAGNAVIFALGVPWLRFSMGMQIVGYTWSQALAHGLYPFLLGSVIKTALVLVIARDVSLWATRRGW